MRVAVNQLRLAARVTAWLATALALPLLAPPAVARTAVAPSAAGCPTAGVQNARVAKVDARLDLTLQDGRSLHLAGLDPVQPTPNAPDFPDRAKDALAALVGDGVSFLPLAASPDRWGRIPAFVFVPRPAPAASERLGEFLLAQGFARYMPVPEAHPCAAIFREAEEKARRAGIGLWSDPYYAILTATNRASFADKAATNVIVEGRLSAVTTDHYRTSLALTPQHDHDFAVTILRRNVTIFERAGLNFRALIGRTLRVRGLLDLRFGPEIEVNSADDIEVVTDGHNEGNVVRQSETGVAPPPAKKP